MKKIRNLLSNQFAKSAAKFLKYICCFLIFINLCGMVLSLIGRQTFILHTSTGTYDNAIYAEEKHDWTMRGPTVSLNKDEIRVFTDHKIDLITQIALSVIYAVHIIPITFCLWLLMKVCHNVSQDRIFIETNAKCLFDYGLIQIAVAAIIPFVKLLISYIANLFTDSKISVSTGQYLLNDLIPGIAFLIAAYIIHYGISLQDEADHTL